MEKKNKAIFKLVSFLLVFTFVIGTMSAPAQASTRLPKSIKNAYIDTLDIRASWGDLSEVCDDSVDCEYVFPEYYEALDVYEINSNHAYYASVYSEPTRKKSTHRYGTAVDILEYNTVGYLNEYNQWDVAVYKCKGTLWIKRVSGEYIITKANRSVTRLVDYTKNIDDEDIVDMISEQIYSFVSNYDWDCDWDYQWNYDRNYDWDYDWDYDWYHDWNHDWVHDDDMDNNTQEDSIKIKVTNCPDTSYEEIITISGKVSADGSGYATVRINGEEVVADKRNGTWSKNVKLIEGENTFAIVATNKKGKSTSIIKKIIFYKDAPRLVIDQCPEKSTVNAITISGKVTDKNDKYPKVYINGELQNVNLYGAWSKKVNLIEGRNTFEIKATNSAGKCVVVIKTIVFNMDVPILVLTNCQETSTLNKVNLSGRVSDVNDKSPKVYINDELVSVNSYYGTWSKDVALKEGDNTFTIKAINSLGKVTTIIKTIKFNCAAPELIISNCPATSTLNKVNLSGRVSDVNDKFPNVYINDELVSVDSYYGTWSKEVTLKEGENTFVIKATNNMNKSTAITRIISYKLN